MAEATGPLAGVPGALAESLARNNKQIRDARGLEVYEELKIAYERELQDSEYKMRSLSRKMNSVLDFSPQNTMALTIVKDLNTREFITTDKANLLEIREERVVFDELKARYKYIFGEEYSSPTPTVPSETAEASA